MKTKMALWVGMIAAAVTVQAGVITFDGYTNGPLNGQENWNARDDFTVTSGTVQINSDSTDFYGARWNEAYSGTHFTLSTDFTFTTVEANRLTFFALGIADRGDQFGFAKGGGGVRQHSDTSYTLHFANLDQTQNSFSSPFSEADIGLNISGGVTTTDKLTLNLVYTYKGGGLWTTDVALFNGATEVATLTTDWSADVVWSDADKFLQLATARIGATSGATVNFDQVSIIPEPGTLGLFVISSAGILLARRVLLD